VYDLSNGSVSSDLEWPLTKISRSCVIRPIDALDEFCAQLTRNLFAIAKFLFRTKRDAILRREPSERGRRMYEKKSRFSTNISLYLRNDAIYSHSYYGRRIGNRTEALEWYQFEWPSVTYNPDFKVMIIQRQIIRKWCNIQLYIQWPTNRKSYDLSNGAIFNELERPLPAVSRSFYSLTLNISETVRDADVVSMEC